MSFKITAADIGRVNIQKKRPQNPSATKDKLAKRRRESGDAYESRSGVQHVALQPPQGHKVCTRCNKNGCDLNMLEKQRLYQQFRELDTDGQSALLISSIDIQLPKEQAVVNSRKKYTYKYSVLDMGARLEVCRATVLDIFQITEKRLRCVIKKMEDGNIAISDQRGKHANHPTLDPQIRQEVRAHIAAFPVIESHYTRNQNPHAMYLESELTVAKMYALFLERQRQQNLPECAEWVYRDIFKREFKHLRLSQPKADTCDKCDNIKAKLADCTALERPAIIVERDSHHAQWEAAMEAYKADAVAAKADPSFVVLTCDMQQIMFTPKLSSSACFYLRKLSNFNFSISRASDAGMWNYLWTEYDGKRGSNEISSGIWKYITSHYQPTNEQRTLVLWMDRCIGQNNNRIVLSALIKLARLGYFTTVEQKFFVTGHSYNQCDRGFGLIEKKLRKSAPKLPEDIETIIRDACDENPFTPIRLTQNDIFDFKLASNGIKFPPSFRVTQHLQYKYDVDEETYLECKRDFDPNSAEETQLMRIDAAFLRTRVPRIVTQEMIKLPEGKIDDLEKMLPFLDGENFAWYSTFIQEQKNLP